MKTSIIDKPAKKVLLYSLVAVAWIIIWYIIYLLVDNDLFVSAPHDVLKRLFVLGQERDFWIAVSLSVGRIILGFLLGIVFGVLMAVVSSVEFVNVFFTPLKVIMRATPVASFIMLAWIWLKRDSIPVFISALMVIPVIWGNVSTGIKTVSGEFKEFAKVYRLGRLKTVKYIYLPGVLPYFATSLCTCAGLVWKAGVAAEVLCQPKKSIGINLFYAKSILETLDVFAWTAVIVIISLLLEALIKFFLKKIQKRFSFKGLV